MPIEFSAGRPLPIKFSDYNDGIDLTLGEEEINLLIGFNHKKMVFNLEDNLMWLE